MAFSKQDKLGLTCILSIARELRWLGALDDGGSETATTMVCAACSCNRRSLFHDLAIHRHSFQTDRSIHTSSLFVTMGPPRIITTTQQSMSDDSTTADPALCKLSRTDDSQRIRERFFQRLGIDSPVPPLPSHSKHTDPSLLRPSRSVVSFEQALKDDPSLSSSPTSSAPSLVHFDSSVTVFCIPSRHDFSNRIASELWTPLEELQENAARNSLEFAAERYDWKQVVTEHDMVVVGNELVHPIHFGIVLDEMTDDQVMEEELSGGDDDDDEESLGMAMDDDETIWNRTI